MFEEEAEEWVIDRVCKDCSRYEKCKGKECCTCKECSKEKWQYGAEFGYSKAEKELVKAKEIIKKFSEFVNNKAELDPEYPEYSQELTDLWNELCEQAEQFLKED